MAKKKRKPSKSTLEYRRVRRNYLQYIRRHSISDYVEPSAIPSKITPADVRRITKEYENLRSDIGSGEFEKVIEEKKKEQEKKRREDELIRELEAKWRREEREEEERLKRAVEHSRQNQEFKAQQRSVQMVTVILNNVREKISNWRPDPTWSKWFAEQKEADKNKALAILEGAIRDDGELAVARRCAENAMQIDALTDSILYGSDGKNRSGPSIQECLIQFAAIVRGKVPSIRESLIFSEDWDDSLDDSDDEDI